MRIFKIENDLNSDLKAILPEQIFDVLQKNNSLDLKISSFAEI